MPNFKNKRYEMTPLEKRLFAKYLARKKRVGEDEAFDRLTIADLYLQGKSTGQMADITGLTERQVSNHVMELERLWLKDTREDFKSARSKAIAKLMALQRILWEGLMWSTKPDDNGEATAKPDSRLAAELRLCIMEQARLENAIPTDEEGGKGGQKIQVNMVTINRPAIAEKTPLEIGYGEISEELHAIPGGREAGDQSAQEPGSDPSIEEADHPGPGRKPVGQDDPGAGVAYERDDRARAG